MKLVITAPLSREPSRVKRYSLNRLRCPVISAPDRRIPRLGDFTLNGARCKVLIGTSCVIRMALPLGGMSWRSAATGAKAICASPLLSVASSSIMNAARRQRAVIARTLDHWKEDADLGGGIHAPDALTDGRGARSAERALD